MWWVASGGGDAGAAGRAGSGGCQHWALAAPRRLPRGGRERRLRDLPPPAAPPPCAPRRAHPAAPSLRPAPRRAPSRATSPAIRRTTRHTRRVPYRGGSAGGRHQVAAGARGAAPDCPLAAEPARLSRESPAACLLRARPAALPWRHRLLARPGAALTLRDGASLTSRDGASLTSRNGAGPREYFARQRLWRPAGISVSPMEVFRCIDCPADRMRRELSDRL